jgi:hypothetical protein
MLGGEGFGPPQRPVPRPRVAVAGAAPERGDSEASPRIQHNGDAIPFRIRWDKITVKSQDKKTAEN